MDDDTAAAISEVALTAQGVKVKLYDKPNALVQLGKRVGAFPNRYEHALRPPPSRKCAARYDAATSGDCDYRL